MSAKKLSWPIPSKIITSKKKTIQSKFCRPLEKSSPVGTFIDWNVSRSKTLSFISWKPSDSRRKSVWFSFKNQILISHPKTVLRRKYGFQTFSCGFCVQIILRIGNSDNWPSSLNICFYTIPMMAISEVLKILQFSASEICRRT